MTVLKQIINGQVIDHGLLFQVSNANKASHTEHMTGKAKADYEKKYKEDSKMVRARFVLRDKRRIYEEVAHTCGPNEPICQYRFIDGHVYELPLGLVNKINQEGKMKKRGQRLGDSGEIINTEGWETLREFVPVGFNG